MPRNVYRVQHIDEQWRVRHEDSTLSSHPNKEETVAAGTAVAKVNEPSQLVVHKMDGTFEYEYTYGGDPSPPKG